MIGMAAMFGSMIPTKESWDPKIEAERQKYLDAKIYPRKLKKQKRKEALFNYNFYKKLQNFNPFEL
jgi:hypothetical protein